MKDYRIIMYRKQFEDGIIGNTHPTILTTKVNYNGKIDYFWTSCPVAGFKGNCRETCPFWNYNEEDKTLSLCNNLKIYNIKLIDLGEYKEFTEDNQ
jgi:hypothetical protein